MRLSNQIRLIAGGMLATAIPDAPAHAARELQSSNFFLNIIARKSGVQTDNVQTLAGSFINTAFTLVGLIFLCLMIYGGFLWMTARGEEDQIGKARKTVTASIIGIFLIVSAYGITAFVTSRLIDGARPAGPGTDSGPTGCCIDWVAGSSGTGIGFLDAGSGANTGGVPTWRITTEKDCRTQGSTPTDTDVLSGPGTWSFSPLPQDIPEAQKRQQCEEIFDAL